MPVFEFDVNGKVLEIEAPDEESALQAVDEYTASAAKKDPVGTEIDAIASRLETLRAEREPGAPASKEEAELMRKHSELRAPRDTKAGGLGLLRSPLNFAEGAGQLMAGAGVVAEKALNKVSGSNHNVMGSYYDRYNAAVNDNRASFEDYAGKGSLLTGDIAAGLVPVGGATGVVTKGAKYLRSVAKAMAGGAAGGGTQFAADGDKAYAMGMGAAFPAATQVLVAAGPGFKNAITRTIERAEQVRTGAFRKAAEAFRQRASTPQPAYTVGQQTGSPALQRLEARAAGKHAQTYYTNQAAAAKDGFDELAATAEKVSGMQARAGVISPKVNETLQTLVTKMKHIRGQQWDKGMDEFATLAATEPAVGTTKLSQEFQKIMAEDANEFNLMGSMTPGSFEDVADAVQKPVSLMKMGKLMQGLRQGMDHSGTVFKDEAQAQISAYRGRLIRALEEDLDSIDVNTLSDRGKEAMAKLHETRKAYAIRSQRLDRLRDDSITKIFGDADAVASPGAALNRFYALDAEDQEYAVRTLAVSDPQVLHAMRAHKLKKSLDAATISSASAEAAKFDHSKFLEEIKHGVSSLSRSPLYGPQMQKQLDEGAAHLAVILNAPGSKGGTTVWPEELAINIVSRSPEFMARAVTRVLYGSQGDKLFFTPQGLQALRTVSNTGKKSVQATSQAAAWLMSVIEDEEREAAKEQQQ